MTQDHRHRSLSSSFCRTSSCFCREGQQISLSRVSSLSSDSTIHTGALATSVTALRSKRYWMLSQLVFIHFLSLSSPSFFFPCFLPPLSFSFPFPSFFPPSFSPSFSLPLLSLLSLLFSSPFPLTSFLFPSLLLLYKDVLACGKSHEQHTTSAAALLCHWQCHSPGSH